MKKILTQTISLLLAVMMIASLAIVASAESIIIDKSDKLSITYADGTFNVAVDAAKLGQLLADKQITKADIVELFPEGMLDIIKNRDAQSVIDFVTAIAAQSGNTKQLVLDLVGGDAEVLKKYASYEELEAIIATDDIIAATDVTALVTALTAAGTLDDLMENEAIQAAIKDNCTIVDHVLFDNVMAVKGYSTLSAQQLADAIGVPFNPSMGWDEVLAAAQPQGIIDCVGLDKFVNNILGGYENIINSVGLDKFVDIIIAEGLIKELPILNVIGCIDVASLKDDVNKAAIKNYLMNNVVSFLINEVTDIKLGGISIYDGGNAEFDHNALQTAILQSIPTVEDVANADDGDAIYTLSLAVTGNVNTTVTFKVTLVGDTTLVNAYADKLVDNISYNVADDGKITGNVNVPVAFNDLYNQFLNTSKFSIARKLQVLGVYTLEGDDMLAVLQSITMDDLKALCAEFNATAADVLQKGHDKIQPYMTYINKIQNMLSFVNDLATDVATEKALANYYVGNGKFEIKVDTAKEITTYVNELADKYGIPSDVIMLINPEDHTVNLDLTAQFTDFYRVRYYDNNGDLLYLSFMPTGADLNIFNNNIAELTGKTWYEGSTVTVTMPAHDTDLYLTPDYYTVVFDANNDDATGIMYDQKIGVGVPAQLFANNYELAHFTFEGWTINPDGTGTMYVDEDTVTDLAAAGETVTLYAQWKQITHIATFIADGKTIGSIEFNEGATALDNVPAVPAKTGYTGVWADYTVADKTDDFTVNAVYTANKYTVKFNANTGDGTMPSQEFTYDVAANLNANTFAKEGFKFIGWNTEPDGKGTAYADKASVKNLVAEGEITLYAIWEAETPTGDSGVTFFVILGVIALAGAAFFTVKMRRKISVK